MTSNKSTSTTTDTELVTVEAYLAGDRKQRAAFKKVTTELQNTRLGNDDLPGAKRAMARLVEFKHAAGTPTAVEFDWNLAVANRLVTFAAIAEADASSLTVPDGTVLDVTAILAHVSDGTATVDTDLRDRILSMPLRRSARVNDVKGLIEAAFYGQPVGTVLTVAEIVRHAAANGSTVSNGAVTARVNADEPTRHAGIVSVRSSEGVTAGFRNTLAIADPDEA